MEYTHDNVHPEIIRAHAMLVRAEAIQGDEYAYGEAVNQARVTRARRFRSKKIREHLGELTVKDHIRLCWFLDRNADISYKRTY